MIRSFACAETHQLYLTGKTRRWSNLRSVTPRKLDQLHGALALTDPSIPPGTRLEALQGSRAGQHSIRINDQWRICFLWKTNGPHAVEIVDYH